MIKKQFLKEIAIAGTQSKNNAGNNKTDVIKIQSWLNLFAIVNPAAATSTGIDGDFGTATETAVKNFQKVKGQPQTGIVDVATFNSLCEPLSKAFQTQASGSNLRDLVVNVAHIHLDDHPFELVVNNQSNSGPWVRSYMDGNEGEPWFWCMGFVQAIIDQAASQLNKDFRTLMPPSFSCDVIGSFGLQKGLLRKNEDVRNNPSLVNPGDIFLVQKSPNDWFHTGLITAVHNDVFETIEGNTNTDGSNNGNGAYKRVRNFRQSKLDVFSIQPLV